MSELVEKVLEEVRKLMKDLPSTDDIKMLIEQMDFLDRRISSLENEMKILVQKKPITEDE
jgi:hypothetical protein